MSDPFVWTSQFPLPDPEAPVWTDPMHEVEEARRRWEGRAAQWRARALAEALFQGEVRATLQGHRVRGAFHGMLHLEVPFEDLANHRGREAAFLACAARDDVLAQVPLIFIFSARPT